MAMDVMVADRSHVPDVVELWKELMEHHASIDPYFEMSDDGPINFEKFVSSLLLLDDARVLVALDSGRVVGYCIGQLMARPPVFRRELHGFVTDMTVTASRRRQGIGTLLMAGMKDWFRAKRVDRVELNVVPGNAAGYSFWRKQGFTDYMHVLYLEIEK
jgi:GNAT superfamily N-acetyltransferase